MLSNFHMGLSDRTGIQIQISPACVLPLLCAAHPW